MMIQRQKWPYRVLYAAFGIASLSLLLYYLSSTVFYFTSAFQFPVNSLTHMPLTLLIFPAEVFSLLFAAYFVVSLLFDGKPQQPVAKLKRKEHIPVAILIPIYNEPKEIVERTLRAALRVRWPGAVRVYVLDDSTTTQFKKNTEELARKYGGVLRSSDKGMRIDAGPQLCIVRRLNREGFKAGNINSAVQKYVSEDFFAVFDSDMAPDQRFLELTMDFFTDGVIGFVQTPQHFVNDGTPLERAAKSGTNIFFHTQTQCKAQDGAMPFCGTNVVVRKSAFMDVNGFSYYTSTEDLDLGIRMNAAGFFGAYVPRILAQGYAPVDFKAYASQQYRWANGNLAILRENWWRLLKSDLSARYVIHQFFTLGWWLVGVVSFIFVLVPILTLSTGLETHHTWLPDVAIAFLYLNVVVGLSMIFFALHGRMKNERVRVSDALLQYSLVTNSMFIYMRAAFNALFRRYVGFVRTDKNGQHSGLRPIRWNLFFAAVCFGLSLYALYFGLRATDVTTMRRFIPVSLWLLFYGLTLASSLLFVGTNGKVTA